MQPLLGCLQCSQLPQVALPLHHHSALKHDQHSQREQGVVPAAVDKQQQSTTSSSSQRQAAATAAVNKQQSERSSSQNTAAAAATAGGQTPNPGAPLLCQQVQTKLRPHTLNSTMLAAATFTTPAAAAASTATSDVAPLLKTCGCGCTPTLHRRSHNSTAQHSVQLAACSFLVGVCCCRDWNPWPPMRWVRPG